MKVLTVALLMIVSLSTQTVADDRGEERGHETISGTMGDKLRVWQSFWAMSGFKYEYHGFEEGVGFAGNNIKEILVVNPEALREANTFAKYQVPTFFTSLASMVAVGYGLATDNESAIYVGAAGLVVSFIFDQIGYSHLKKSVKIYNKGLNRF